MKNKTQKRVMMINFCITCTHSHTWFIYVVIERGKNRKLAKELSVLSVPILTEQMRNGRN